jgi:hypothetical protein
MLKWHIALALLVLILCQSVSAKRLVNVQYVLGGSTSMLGLASKRVQMARNAKIDIPEKELAEYACTSLDGPNCREFHEEEANDQGKISTLRKFSI